MDMSSMSMSPTSASASMAMSSTMSMAAASATSSGMGGMSMGGSSCKISMTWNWYTVGACFISKQWHVTSRGMFAGSCIGVIFLVISLEFLRRMQREYDGYIRRKDMGAATSLAARQQGETPDTSASSDHEVGGKHQRPTISTSPLTGNVPPLYRPHVDRMTLLQRQFIRALIHMVQFAVAYFIMLLAMYYNGYIIICIIIGAFLGSFIFTWDQLLNEINQKPQPADVTGCCG